MAKYQVTFKNDVGDIYTDIVLTDESYVNAIKLAIDGYYDDEDCIFEIMCERMEE